MYRDIAFAFRQLRTNLRFSLIVVLTLALGIGATTAIFSVVSGVLLRALPFPDSERGSEKADVKRSHDHSR
jgi:putative ABC transport system permease protein